MRNRDTNEERTELTQQRSAVGTDHRAGRRRRLGAGETTAGRGADPRAGAGASVEADDRGGEVSVGWQRSPKPKGVTRSFVNQLLRLTLLAPEIIEAILDGRQPKVMQLEELTRAIPSEWEKQRRALLAGAA